MDKTAQLFSNSSVLSSNEAMEILMAIEGGMGKLDLDFDELYSELIQSALNYSGIRANWFKLSNKEKLEKDSYRTITHNVFINDCDILSRYMGKNGMDNLWRERLGSDRKKIGDFACWITSIVAIRER